ncbi:MAG: nicotinamide mononucleotide deamidase-related protein [Zestosphaera sp.]
MKKPSANNPSHPILARSHTSLWDVLMYSKAWVFTLGTEVVSGRVVNTNASYIGRRLTLLGFDVLGVVSLVDDVGLISTFLSYVLESEPDLIVTTGGLGPTYDDVTLEAVAKAVGRGLAINDLALEMVRKKYEKLKLPLTPERIKMARLPEGCEVIPNEVGTAPGCLVRHGRTLIVSLPGVPKELEAMWESWVEPRLKGLGVKRVLAERTFTVTNVPESSAARVVKELLHKYGNIYIKTHPKGREMGAPVLEVYVQVSAERLEDAERTIERVLEDLKRELMNEGGVIS